MSLAYARKAKIKGDFLLMKEESPGLKPNFSALVRELGLSRQTVSKLWKEADQSPKPRKSKFDPYYSEIYAKFEQNATTIRAVFMYFQNKYGEDSAFSNYDSFKSYVKKHNLNKVRGEYLKVHVRYENDPGDELQVDWVESLKMPLKSGEVIEYNIFTTVFGYSRYVMLIYSRTKTTEDFMRCVLEAFDRAGGKPVKIKTDNMSAVVKMTHGHKKKLPVIREFEKGSPYSSVQGS